MSTLTGHTDLKAAFESFLKEPWPQPDSQMSERKRLWCAFDAGAQWAIDSIRAAFPLREAPTDEQDAVPYGHAMLPNDSHPGSGCSCRDCLERFK